jgi:hypothetical protein
MTRSRLITVLVGVALAVSLPLAGHWLRQGGPPRCAYDGQHIEPRYRVRVVDHAGRAHDCCCARCATRWLEQSPDAADVVVTDEPSGEEIDSRGAYFVESAVVTNRVTGNHVHAFRDRAAAEEHARAYGGLLLKGSERPLQLGEASK